MNRLRSSLVPLAFAAVVALFQQACAWSGRDFYLTQATMAAYYTVAALGLSLLMGHAGQVSLGHGAFFALGGFTSAVLTTRPIHGLPEAWADRLAVLGALMRTPDFAGQPVLVVAPSAAFAAAMLLTLLVALAIGYPALRLRGHYLAMATLGFGLIVYRLLLGCEITGAADGINGVPGWHMAGLFTLCRDKAQRIPNYYFAWLFVLVAFVLLRNLVVSRFGRALHAIHDNETAAAAMGVNTARVKLQAFVISAMLTAAAGACFTHYAAGIGPSQAGAMNSVRYVALVAAGGMASLEGVMLAGAALTFLWLRGCFGTFDDAVFGAILIAIVTWSPRGPFALAATLWRRAVRPAAAHGEPRHGAA